MSNWKTGFGIFNSQIKKETEKRLHEITKHIFKQLVERSPIDTGSYCLSHNITINGEDCSFETIGETALNHLTLQQEALKKLLKIEEAIMGDYIVLQNNVISPNTKEKYGIAIEFYGRSKQAPRGVYRLALVSTEAWAETL